MAGQRVLALDAARGRGPSWRDADAVRALAAAIAAARPDEAHGLARDLLERSV